MKEKTKKEIKRTFLAVILADTIFLIICLGFLAQAIGNLFFYYMNNITAGIAIYILCLNYFKDHTK